MSDIRIGTIRVRVDDLTPAQGQQLGERIAALLGQRLADDGAATRDVGFIRARMTRQGGETVDQLAVRVVGAIVEAM